MHATRITPALRKTIVRRILRVAKPRKVILFGSAARGEMTPDSDIDLLVIEDTAPDPRGESVRICDALRGLGTPFDVSVMESIWFEESKRVVGGLAYPAHREGRVLYEAARSHS